MYRITLFILFFFVSSFVFAQFDDDAFWFKEKNDDLFEGITDYDKYNPFMEGDSVRICGRTPCNGMIKDLYPDNVTTKHQGSYVNGKLTSVYKNFYPNGQLERFFQLDANGASAKIDTYFPNGNPHLKVVYRRGNIILYEEYQEDGKTEMLEKMDNKAEYHLYQKYFYPNGQLFSDMTLVNKGKLIYSFTTYYETGEKRSEGSKISQKATGDYLKHGDWKYFSTDGKMVKAEQYSHGRLQSND
jgi:antitoxin component YwqK of YwqJK toxin-antitoxin module